MRHRVRSECDPSRLHACDPIGVEHVVAANPTGDEEDRSRRSKTLEKRKRDVIVVAPAIVECDRTRRAGELTLPSHPLAKRVDRDEVIARSQQTQMASERAGGDEHAGIDIRVRRIAQHAVIHQHNAAIVHRQTMALLLESAVVRRC
jgi:hypothetical protein